MGTARLTLFLGIDGGGTKTDFLLIDGSGRVLATHRAGPAYYFEIGFEGLETLLVNGINSVLTKGALTAADITHAFAGLPAYGESEALLGRFDSTLEPLLARSRYHCGNDVVCSWAGALAGHSGIAVVAGTGSIAYGEYGSKRARAGGWGELFGDEGSAYWIARETLTLFSRMSDGRMSRSALYHAVREHFGRKFDLDVCAAVYGPPALARSELAALARLASAAAHAGDADARIVFERAASELAALVVAVNVALEVPSDVSVPVSYCGGLFSADDLLLPLFQQALAADRTRYAVMPPQLTPIAGAALHAATLSGQPLTQQALVRLRGTQAVAAPRGLG